MFDRLVDLFMQFLHLFRFWAVVLEGDQGVIYTLGRPTRLIGARDGLFKTGLHLKAPLGVERDHHTSVREDTEVLLNQDLMTSDGHTVRVSGAFKYQILPEKVIVWQTTLGNELVTFPTICRAAVAETIVRRPFGELMSEDDLKELRQEILDRARKELNRYGYKIYDFWWTERTSGRTYRLITGE